MSPQNIQLGIQGGGAKVVDLMAAMEAIEDLERDGKIRVTRVAGASAGALVGALFSAGIQMANVRQRLRDGQGRELLNSFSTPGRIKILRSLLLNISGPSSVWSDQQLRGWLEKLFHQVRVRNIKELCDKRGIPTTIVSTDLRSRSMQNEYRDVDLVVDALLDSCGLPYLFRVWSNNSGNPIIVDGGICENLPCDLLENSGNDGDVVAISFCDNSATGSPQNFYEFSLSLLDTAISHSVRKARNSSSVSVLSIDTHIGTFDFKQALEHGLGDHYENTKNYCKEWFSEFLSKKEENRRIFRKDPWRTNDPTALSVMDSVAEVYNQQHAPSKINYHKCAFIIHAYCLLDPSESHYRSPDRVHFSFTFEPVDDPIYCIRFGLLGDPGANFLREKIDCRVFDRNGERVGITQVPARDKNEPKSRDLCVFFDRPLRKGDGTYTIEFAEEAYNLLSMDESGRGVEDNMLFTATRASEKVDEVHLVLHVPKAYRNVVMRPTRDDFPGKEMGQKMLDNCGYHPNNFDFVTKGWFGEDIPADLDDWGVDIRGTRT